MKHAYQKESHSPHNPCRRRGMCRAKQASHLLPSIIEGELVIIPSHFRVMSVAWIENCDEIALPCELDFASQTRKESKFFEGARTKQVSRRRPISQKAGWMRRPGGKSGTSRTSGTNSTRRKRRSIRGESLCMGERKKKGELGRKRRARCPTIGDAGFEPKRWECKRSAETVERMR